MAPVGPPTAVEITQRFSEWDTEHAAIISQYEAEERREKRALNEAKKTIIADIAQEKQALEACHSIHPSLLPYFERKRSKCLNQLQEDYEAKKAQRKQVHSRRVLEHMEMFSAFIALASTATAGPAKQVPSQTTSKKSSPIPAADSRPPSSSSKKSDGDRPDPDLVRAGSASQPAKSGARVNGHRDNSEGREKQAQQPANLADRDASNKAASQHPGMPEGPSPSQLAATAPDVDHVANPMPAPAPQKRKADSQPSSPQARLKKAKIVDVDNPEKGNDAPQRQSQKKPAAKRSISFDEVYQDGHAEYKHVIIEYPPGEGDWYILKCDEHGVHFNLNPLHGSAKHLHGIQHNYLSKEHSLAIATLGHLVFDCDAEMAEKNNAAVRKAFERGYKPFNRNHLTKSERAIMGFGPVETPKARKMAAKILAKQTPSGSSENSKSVAKPPPAAATSTSFSGVTHPVPGELYLGYWSKNKTKYAVMLLPWGDLSVAGMLGTLATTGLLVRAPRCYLIDRLTQGIKGWAKGYEDGGPLLTKREFPVMYFDGARSVGWLRAKDLSLFDMEDPGSILIPNFQVARDHYARAHGYDSYETMKGQRQKQGLPEMRLSAVGQPSPQQVSPIATDVDKPSDPPASTTESAQPAKLDKGKAGKAGKGPGQDSGSSTSGPKDSAGSLAQADKADSDVEMTDIPLPEEDDDTESYHDSDAKDDSDEDVNMEGGESRRTSISTKAAAARDAGKDTTAPKPTAKDKAAKSNAAEDKPDEPAHDTRSANTTTPATHVPVNSSREPKPIGPGEGTTATLSEANGDQDQATTSDTTTKKTGLSKSQEAANGAGDAQGAKRQDNTTASSGPSPPHPGNSVSSAEATPKSKGSMSPPTRNPQITRRSPAAPASTNLSASKSSEPRRESWPDDTQNGLQKLPRAETMAPPRAGSHPLPNETPLMAGPRDARSITGQATGAPLRAASAEAARNPLSASKQRESSVARSEGVPARQSSQDILQSNGQTTQASKLSPGFGAGMQARSSSSTPGPMSKPPSGSSTPIIVRPDDMAQMSRWRAVRSEPTPPTQPDQISHSRPQTPSSTSTAPANPARRPSPMGDSRETLRAPSKSAEGASLKLSADGGSYQAPLRVRSVGAMAIKPDPYAGAKTERFELAMYEDGQGNFFLRQKDGPHLQLTVDALTKMAKANLEGGRTVRIEPMNITRMLVEQLDESGFGACRVTLTTTKEGMPKEQKFVLEETRTMGREENGRIHTRRFCRWAKTVNGEIEYQYKSFGSSTPAIPSRQVSSS